MRRSLPVPVLLAFMLSACGGGDSSSSASLSPPPAVSDPIPDAKPGGYYTGSVSQEGETFDIEGLVTEDGHAILISEYGIYATRFAVAGDAFDNSFTAYAFQGDTWDGTNSVLSGNIDGTIDERTSIDATYTLGGENGTVALDYDRSIYEEGAAEDRIVGDWGYSVPDTGYTIDITFSSDGTFFGQDTESCTYQGKWSIPDENYNGYRFTETGIDCIAGSVSWEGVAFVYGDAAVGTDVMLLGIHNAESAYVDLLARN